MNANEIVPYARINTLAAGVNLDTVTTPGFYNLLGSVTAGTTTISTTDTLQVTRGLGDTCTQVVTTNTGQVWIRQGTNLSDTPAWTVWRQVLTDTSTFVNSFNTRTGAVTLTTADITAALGYTPPNSGSVVSSFNTRTGAVTLTSSDVTSALGFNPLNLTISAAQPGYILFGPPGSLMIQFGIANAGDPYNTPITFPVAFSSAVYSVVATGYSNNNFEILDATISLTGFSMKFSNYGARTGWIAIGV